jgi:cytidylate kinase
MEYGRDVITVDGLAASGKSALAKGLAAVLGYGHLNSGLLYRAVALIALRDKVALTDQVAVVNAMNQHSIVLTVDPTGASAVAIDGFTHVDELSATEVSSGASLVARHQQVRDLLLKPQREAFEPGGVVAEGRDMGTVIFPAARVKFFVVARLEVRAARRYQQLLGTPQESSLQSIIKDLEERDKRDSSSSVGTMKQAQGALLIDNSDQSLPDVLAHMVQAVNAAPRSLR